MGINRAYSLEGINYIVIELPEADAENWEITFSTDTYQTKANMFPALKEHSNTYRNYTRVKGDEFAGEEGIIMQIKNHRNGTSPYNIISPRPIKKGETYTISAKFFIPEESNNGSRSDVPMVSMYNPYKDENDIPKHKHRANAQIPFKGRWVEVSKTHTFEKDEPQISFLAYGAYFEPLMTEVTRFLRTKHT